MAVDAAVVRGIPNRAADIGSTVESRQPRGQGSRGSAGRTPGCASCIPGIACLSVDVVVALEVPETERHVGLAEEVRASGFESFNDVGIPAGEFSSNAGIPQLVGRPAMSNDSLIVIGRP